MKNEDKNTLFNKLQLLVTIVLVVSVTAMFILSFEYDIEEKLNSFRTSKNIYCPSSYTLVKGDGVFTYDYSKPLVMTKTNIVYQENYYLYDDKGNAFRYSECIIRKTK